MKANLADQKSVRQRAEQLLLSEIEMLHSRLGVYEQVFDKNNLAYNELRSQDEKHSSYARSAVRRLKERLRTVSVASTQGAKDGSSNNCKE